MKSVSTVKGWFLQGVNYADAPESLAELSARFAATVIDSRTLASTPKWEPLIQGKAFQERLGWVPLAKLAATRRGIATGANEFFLVSASRAAELRLRESSLVRCVGRANDVSGLIFNINDFIQLKARNGRCLLLDIKDKPTSAERAYIKLGEEGGLTERYILANRSPWYSMEQRDPAPIWAAVFGRGDLKFVFNAALARSLTNFHCVYPIHHDPDFTRALTVILNSRVVRAESRLHIRGYGGGLMKFEPNDLKSIMVPDLRAVSSETIAKLSQLLSRADEIARSGLDEENFQREISEVVLATGEEAGGKPTRLL